MKKVAKHLLSRVRKALVLDWRQKAQARAEVRFEHVYETFTEREAV